MNMRCGGLIEDNWGAGDGTRVSSAKRICWKEGFLDTLAEGGLIRRERFDWSLVYFRVLDSSSRRNACLENRTLWEFNESAALLCGYVHGVPLIRGITWKIVFAMRFAGGLIIPRTPRAEIEHSRPSVRFGDVDTGVGQLVGRSAWDEGLIALGAYVDGDR